MTAAVTSRGPRFSFGVVLRLDYTAILVWLSLG